jgi:hypothetical protein
LHPRLQPAKNDFSDTFREKLHEEESDSDGQGNEGFRPYSGDPWGTLFLPTDSDDPATGELS